MPSNKPVIFVIGATGNIGAATVKVLSSKYGDKLDIIAGVRNPDKADSIKLPGVNVVQATMGDKDTLKVTLKGVDALYIIAPATENRAELAVTTAEAAKEAKVKFLLAVSVPTVVFPDTVFGGHFSKIETKISQLGVPYAFLRLPMFMENIWGNKATIQSQSCFYGSATKKISAINAEDAGKVGAAILSDYTKHERQTYTIASDTYTNNELASAFTEVLGREIKYVVIPKEASLKAVKDMGFAQWQLDGMFELFDLVENDTPEITQIDSSIIKTLTGDEPTSMKAWVAKYGQAFK